MTTPLLRRLQQSMPQGSGHGPKYEQSVILRPTPPSSYVRPPPLDAEHVFTSDQTTASGQASPSAAMSNERLPRRSSNSRVDSPVGRPLPLPPAPRSTVDDRQPASARDHDSQWLLSSVEEQKHRNTAFSPTACSTVSTPSVPPIIVLAREEYDSNYNSDSEAQTGPSIVIGDATPEIPAFTISCEDDSGKSLPEQSATSVIDSLSRLDLTSGIVVDSRSHCGSCCSVIAGRVVEALGKRWHPECFRCEHCQQHLEHIAFYEYEGKAFCGVDYDELFSLKCFHCATSITDEAYVTLDDPSLSGGPRHYHQLHLFCAECGDPFLDPKSLEEKSRISTNPNLRDDGSLPVQDVTPHPFVLHRGYPYCESCHIRLHKPKCGGCRQPILDDVIKALGKQWHDSCFVCTDCQKPFISGMYFNVGGTANVCDSCYEMRSLFEHSRNARY